MSKKKHTKQSHSGRRQSAPQAAQKTAQSAPNAPLAQPQPSRRPGPIMLYGGIVGVVALLALLVIALTQNNNAVAPASVATAAPAAAVAGETSVPASFAPLPPEVSVQEAASMRDQGAFILDVREPYEWEAVHIPDATLIPLGTLAQRVAEVPKDKEIVVVCRSGNRSQQGRDILLRAGFKRVTSIAGGMNQWSAAGFPTASGQ
ncbi:MAG: rhodanese-like domain-containing protein [Anaerolineae bacterium]